ncbi:MAG: hypothetical protein QXZ40_02790, partial [Candidatus Micrarchaeia archaeon]
MRRMQISVDFLIIGVFAFIIFFELFQLYYIETDSAGILESRASAMRIASIVARAINEVGKANETSMVVTIPETLDTGDTYHMSIKASGRRVDVFWPISTQNRSIAVPLLTSNVTELDIPKTAGSGLTTLRLINLNGKVNISIINVCGDGVCTSGENCQNCAADCSCYCGDGVCTSGEDCNNCAADCGCPAPTHCCNCPSIGYIC